jgi:hypothetical protein
MVHPPASPLRRRLLLAGGACAALVGCGTPGAPAAPAASGLALRLLAEGTLPHKLAFQGTTVGGLSGLDFDPASGLWLALSDDRSELQPARFYTLRLPIATGRELKPELLQAVTLKQAAGTPYPPRRAGGEVVDPEGIRWLPGGRSVLWTSEGDPRVHQGPGLREVRLDGSHVRDFRLPAELQLGPRPGTGPRDNETFEGLALTPDGRFAWVAMEGALQQDGPQARVGEPGGPCRVTLFDLARGEAVRQVAYQADAIPQPPRIPGGFADNGVSEILMLDARRLLVLERAYAMGVGNSLRLYVVDTAEATDTLGRAKLEAGTFRAAPKQLVADFATLGLSRLDNTEGLCWGPRLPNGRRCLVAVSDDNFNASQVTQFAAFEFLE